MKTFEDLQKYEAAMTALKALSITPFDLLAYALALDAKDLSEEENPEQLTMVEAVDCMLEVENDDPSLGSDLYMKAREIAATLDNLKS